MSKFLGSQVTAWISQHFYTSCGPNAQWAFDHRCLKMELRALRQIEPNEEITIAYKGVLSSRKNRQAGLRSEYGFSCTCPSCSPRVKPSELKAAINESDQRRTKIAHCNTLSRPMWKEWVSNPSRPENVIVDMHKEILPLLKIERLQSHLGIALQWIAFAYAALGDVANFQTWGKQAKAWNRVVEDNMDIFGFQSDQEWVEWLSDPTTCPLWNIRRKE